MPIYFFLAFFFLWISFLTYHIFKVKRHYQNLIGGSGKEKLDEVLEVLLKDDQRLQKDIELIKKELKEASEESRFYFRKIGVVRFSPFGRSGSDQSFALALLDREDNGIVVNFIYTSEGLRVYTKRVKQGKGEEYQLSEEEEKAIKLSK